MCGDRRTAHGVCLLHTLGGEDIVSRDQPGDQTPDKSQAIRQAVRQLWKLVFMPPLVAAMFLLAGTWRWPMGWLTVPTEKNP